MKRGNFFAELKRRNVLRACAFYAASAWLLVQIATQVFPFFHVAEWVVRAIIVAAMIGFPFVTIFSWFYEWTPQGFQRETERASDETAPHSSSKKLDRWIIAILSLAVILLLTDRLVLRQDKSTAGMEPVAAPPKSIAVLPFVNTSSDRENEYFVDGLTEEILDRLSQISALRVPGRTSSFAFKNKTVDLRQIGATLSVAHVLEGSVRKSGNQLRITAELIRTADGYHLWSQSFDRKLDDVFAVQEEIARAIADALSTPLGLNETTHPLRPTRNMEAYDSFLQARGLLVDRTGEKLQRALGLLSSAVERDPGFGNGWAALAQAHALSFYYLSAAPEPLKKAEEAARKALAIDDSIASAHSALADVLRDRHDWLAAEHEYQRALQLSSGEAETHNQYGQMLLKLGRLDGSLRYSLRACELEPLGWVPASVVALTYLSRGDYVKSRAFLDRSEKISGTVRGFQTRVELLYALSLQDRDLARRALMLALARPSETWSSNPPSTQFIGMMDQVLGNPHPSPGSLADLGKALQEMRTAGQPDTGVPFSSVAAFVGQKQAALDALFVELETPGNDIAAVIWTPVYRSVHSEARFRDLVTALNMPPYWRAAGWSESCRPKGENDFECGTP